MSRRSYNEYCGLAHGLDVVGERWTLLIVRNLLLGPLRYSDLQRGLPGITTNLLAKRLREMERDGLVERIRQGTAAGEGGRAYRLTPEGLALEPAVQALAAWGARRMTGPRAGEHRDLEWLLVSTRRRYRGGLALAAEVVVDGAPYHFVLSEREAVTGRGPLARPDVRVRIAAPVLMRLLAAGWPESGAVEHGEVEGDPDGLRALVEAFHPMPASALGGAREAAAGGSAPT